ncbi:MAG: hypothetical protein M3R04_08515 [bacterium]|nr:hypothetical protein [bacterium]
MKARRTLWLYCLLATVALAGSLISIVASAGPLRTQSAVASDEVQSATVNAESQRETVLSLEEEQRANRSKFSAEDAIRMSSRVQQQQAVMKKLDDTRDSAEDKYQLLSVAYQNHMKRLIPIIGLLILHIVGSMLFWPRKEEEDTAKKSR